MYRTDKVGDSTGANKKQLERGPILISSRDRTAYFWVTRPLRKRETSLFELEQRNPWKGLTERGTLWTQVLEI